MSKKDIASVFQEAIEKAPAERQALLDELAPEDRNELRELLAADQEADENNLFSSLQYNPEEKPVRVSPPKEIRDYQIGELIGEGGMGQVYKARHSRLKCDVAIKIMSRADRPSRQVDVARFDREIAAIGSLRHPNIVQATDAGVDGDINYLVMEFINGSDLSHVLKSKTKLAVPNACEIIRQTALGLSHAHDQGMIHRDIKPSNLMITTDGTVKLADMGLALLRNWDSQVSMPGQIMGTLDYISPEQIDNSQDVDQRSDLYSLGCMFFELLAGKAPFSAPEFATTLQKLEGHGRGVPPALSEVRPEVPKELSAIVSRLMAKDPAERFQTAADLANAVTPFARGAEVGNLVCSTMGVPESAIDTNRIANPATRAFVERRVANLPKPAASKTSSWIYKLLAIGLLAILGVGLAVNGNQILRIVTNKGVLVIENSEDVEISISRGSDEPVVVFDKVIQRQYTLDVGDDYQLLIKEPKSGIELSSKTFSIKRNEKTILSARVESVEGNRISKLGLENASHGEVANWLLEHGAKVIKGFDRNSSYFSFTKGQHVPAELELSSKGLELWFGDDEFTKLELEEFLQVSSMLPVEVVCYFGDNINASVLRFLAKQKDITHLRFYSHFDYEELFRLPEGSFKHVDILLLRAALPVEKVEPLAKYFPNLNLLNIVRFDYDRIDTLKQFPLTNMVIQLGVSESMPKFKTHTKLKTLSIVYEALSSKEPEFDLNSLPPNIEVLNIQNAFLTAEHFKQLRAYDNLSVLGILISENCVRDPLEMSDAIAGFRKLRPGVKVTLTLPQ